MFLRPSALDGAEEGGLGSTGGDSTGGYSRSGARGYGAGLTSPGTPGGGYGRHSYGSSLGRPGTSASMYSSSSKFSEDDRPASAGGLGTAGALPSTETRKSMLERQRELQRKRRAARASGGFMATSRNISGPDGPRSPHANPQVTRSIRQFSAPRSSPLGREEGAGGKFEDDAFDKGADSAGPTVTTTSLGSTFGSAHPSTPGSTSGMSLKDAIREREKMKRSGGSSPMRSMTAVERDMAAKGIPSSFDPATAKTRTSVAESKTVVTATTTPDLSDMTEFLTTPTPKSCGVVQCYINRYKSGMNKLYPLYHLFLGTGDKFLLAGKKRSKQRTSNYLISANKDDLSRTSEHFLGKLRSNGAGSEFTAYDRGANPKDVNERAAKSGVVPIRQELALVSFTKNARGEKGPRKIRVCVPRVREDTNVRQEFKPLTPGQNMMSDLLAENQLAKMVYMINKPPQWNESVGAYVLNFNGRVTMASVKNFQLVDPDDKERVILQFGRVGKDVFTMDYQWPLCPLQAFAIALSSFDYKIE